MLNDPLANVLSIIGHYERLGRTTVTTPSNSKFIRDVLRILHENNYIGEVTEVDDGKGKWLRVELIGAINKINVIKPRFDIKKTDFEKFEKSFLPARAMGLLLISTSKGLMTHRQAREQGLGGKLICYCY
jgi:small subunit ribosomal protein S8